MNPLTWEQDKFYNNL